jgi:hypothetical protein
LSSHVTTDSWTVVESLPKDSRPEYHIIFIDHHKHTPTRHPENGVRTAPDILAVHGPSSKFKLYDAALGIYHCVPWQAIVSTVEPKPVDNPRVQLSSYAWDHMTARPDMPGVYGLGVRASGYEIIWSDASGVIASPRISWESRGDVLASYIHSLYRPPTGHFTSDRSIELNNDDPKSTTPPTWTIRFHGEKYLDCKLLFFGPSWGRRTSVWIGVRDGETFVIKDAYRDEVRRYCEGQLLEEIHGEGGPDESRVLALVPGVVRLVSWGFVRSQSEIIATVRRPKSPPAYRQKTRLVLGSTGVRLEESQSVLDLLKAVYDVIEGVRSHSSLHEF